MATADQAQRAATPQDLADMLREAIHSGQYRAGSLLPSETELTTLYHASRYAVRQAKAVLEREGLIRSSTQGTRICQPPSVNVVTRGKGDPFAALERTGKPKPLMLQADDAMAELLQINRNHPLYVLAHTARAKNGRPVHTQRLLPMSAVVETPLETDPYPDRPHLIKILTKAHGPLTFAERVRYREAATPEEATDLDVPEHGFLVETILIGRAQGRTVIAEIMRTDARTVEYEYPV
jgi:DNA-binding GntR family transcriptional regulator